MKTLILIFSLHILVNVSLYAIVKYDEGRIEIDGIQLFQDSENDLAYFYQPPYPMISTLDNGDFEFFCTKYVGSEGKASSGGLFHALIKFSLTGEEVSDLQEKLREKIPNAVIMGVVPMMENEDGTASFRIVSTILKPGEENPFNSSVITSGKAPFLPGSKAAIAAHLEPDGATLLWDSFQGVTSDVSVVVEGYFRAKVKAYQATVKANLELVYNHFSSFENVQSGFTRDQTTEILDSLSQEGIIDIQVADLSAGLDVNTEAYQNILSIITEKVVALMFDVKSGWAEMPETETAAQPTDLKERYQRGAFVRFFAGDGTQTYVPDDQLLLKKKTEIRNFNFFLNLNQSTVIKVPVYSAGNIGGFYKEYKDDSRYFRVLDMIDFDFQHREVHFQVDGDFLHSFGDIIDHASVNVQKDYVDSSQSHVQSIVFRTSDIDSGNFMRTVSYPRLGDHTEDWLRYKYKVGWKFIGIDSVVYSPNYGWINADLLSVSIQPPLTQTRVEIGIDKELLKQQDIRSVRIRFASTLFGSPFKGKMVVIRENDTEDQINTTVYHDQGQAIVYQVNWYTSNGVIEENLKILDDDYLFLIPPKKNN